MNELTKIQQKIHIIRGYRVMLDFDLAQMYGVETRVLNQSVKRNIERFPEDFMFQLTALEWETMSSQFVTTSRMTKTKSTNRHACSSTVYLSLWQNCSQRSLASLAEESGLFRMITTKIDNITSIWRQK